MIRSILRTFSRFLMAVVLFALLLCAVEVWFRWERLNENPSSHSVAASIDNLVRPSSTTWIDVADLVDMEIPVGLEETSRLRTSEFGTRGSSLSVPKPAGTFRVVCLGGSGLFGLGQRDEETITAQLQTLFQEAQLSHVEFVNAGCPGSGVMTNFLRLRTRLISLQPNIVLYCLSTDDIIRDSELRGALTLDQQGRPAYATHPASRAQTKDKLGRVCEEFATANWLNERVGPIIGLSESKNATQSPETDLPESLQSLREMKELCEANNCRLMISIIPNAWTQNPKTGVVNSKNPQAFERDLHEFFAEHQIQSTSMIHNPSLLFQQNGQEQGLYEERTGNLNTTGNIMYARTIAKSMVDFFPAILQHPVEDHSPLLPVPPLHSPPARESTPNDSIPLTSHPEPRESILQ